MLKPIIDFFASIINLIGSDFMGFFVVSQITLWTVQSIREHWLEKRCDSFMFFDAFFYAIPFAIVNGLLYCWARPVLVVLAGYDSTATITDAYLSLKK